MSEYDKQGQMPPSYSPPEVGYGAPPQAGYGQPQPAYSQPQPMYPNPQAQYSAPGGTASHTTVIVQQPTNIPGAPGMAPRMWSTGICDCFEDMGICCCGAFFGLCLACQVSTDMGESGCVPCCVPAADISLRVKWRTQENIQGSILDDCMTVWCCGPCAMCQLAREVKRKKEGTLYPRA